MAIIRLAMIILKLGEASNDNFKITRWFKYDRD